MLIPAGYVTTTYDPIFKLSDDGTRYLSAPSDVPTTLAPPGLPFSLVFRCEPGKEDWRFYTIARPGEPIAL